MPLVALSTLAFAAGLAAGFAGAPASVCAAFGLLATALYLSGYARGCALAIVASAGVLLALLEAHDRSDCERRLPSAAPWRVLLHQDARPTAFVRGVVLADRCRLPVSLSVASGQGRAGSTVFVRGSLVIADGRAMVDRAILGRVDGEAWLVSMRARAGDRIDRIFRSDSSVARALLIADSRGLTPDIRERYADAGLVHMLSISGLHVAIIAAALELVFQLARLSPQASRVGTILLTALYIAIIGAPAPAVRSGVMLAATMLSRLLQRPTSPWSGVALGAAIPLLLDVRVVLDLGYQLSVAGIIALAASASLAKRWRVGEHRFGGITRGLLASCVATVVTAPLIAWHFGRISVIAPLTNLMAGPVIGVAQPMLFLALLLSPVHALGSFVADAVHPLLRLFDLIATAGASVPYAALGVTPSLVTAICAGVATAAFVVAACSHFPARASLAAVTALAFMVWAPDGFNTKSVVELHMIDVGQGDALALRSAAGRWLVVDAGRQWRGGDAGRSKVIPYLRTRGGAVHGFVLTHPHADHAGGAASIIRALKPARFWDPAFVEGNAVYRDLLREVRAHRTAWRRVRPAERLDFDGTVVEFLGPDSAWTASLDDPNEASVIVRVTVGAVRFLLVGDAEREEESWLLEHARGSLSADVLKVGHHGSSTSSTAAFLDAVAPRVALISVGAGNKYRHPSPDVVRALQSRKAQVLRTDQVGSVVVRTDGQRVWIRTNGGSWELPPLSAER